MEQTGSVAERSAGVVSEDGLPEGDWEGAGEGALPAEGDDEDSAFCCGVGE